jgi:hypothetical protein
LVSAGVLTSNSSTSLTAIVNTLSAVEPSALVARTVMFRLASSSRSIAPATVTTPVVASMANLPPALSNRL